MNLFSSFKSLALLGAGVLLGLCGCGDNERGVLLVGNTRSHNVVKYDERTGEYLGEFITAGSGGLLAPDNIVSGPDGHLYVASGDKPENSAVLRYDGKTGRFLGTFASGNGMHRPYGLAFGKDNRLYVSSFMSDQLLRFDANTGAFVDVFARGNGQPGGLNGPNGLLFGPDGKLYITTQGSVAGQFPGLPSQVLRYDTGTGQGEVFVDQPALSNAGVGFISLLGMAFGPACEQKGGECDLFVSDFANDVRRYDLGTRALEATLSTNYSGATPSTNLVGSLVFGEDARLYIVGFDSTEGGGGKGALLRFDGKTNALLPASGQVGALFVAPDSRMVRPIGIAFTMLPRD